MFKRILAILIALMLLLPAAWAEQEQPALLMPYYGLMSMLLGEDVWIEAQTDHVYIYDNGEELGTPIAMVVPDGRTPVQCGVFTEAFCQSDMAREMGANGFWGLGRDLLEGRTDLAADAATVQETGVINGLPFVKVEMLGQGFEMYYIDLGQDVGYVMYPAVDEAIAAEARSIAMTFHLASAGRDSVCEPADYDTALLEDGTLAITGYHGESNVITVPAEIDGKPVTALAENAFYETPVKWVSIPDSVRSMGDLCFSGCNDLETIHLPGTIEEIPYGAFESCYRLHELILPEGVKHLGAGALFGCMYLEEVHLPASLESIQPGNFTMSPWLWGYEVAPGSAHFRTERDGGVLLSADGKRLVDYAPWHSDEESYTVPDGVEVIDPDAFDETALTEIILPESIREIGGGAFFRANIKRIVIPEGCETFGIMRGIVMKNEQGEYVKQDGTIPIFSTKPTIVGVKDSPAYDYAQANGFPFEEIQ